MIKTGDFITLDNDDVLHQLFGFYDLDEIKDALITYGCYGKQVNNEAMIYNIKRHIRDYPVHIFLGYKIVFFSYDVIRLPVLIDLKHSNWINL